MIAELSSTCRALTLLNCMLRILIQAKVVVGEILGTSSEIISGGVVEVEIVCWKLECAKLV